MNKSMKITFITPCFNRGAFETPEIRSASIRGQLHWWFRALGYGYEDEKAVFGGVHNGATASKVVVRVAEIAGKVEDAATLPHKKDGPSAPKSAYAPGTTFQLNVTTRLGGLSREIKPKFERALDAWLYLGSLGLRATRGGGNFTWDGQPAEQDYISHVKAIAQDSPLRFALPDRKFDSAEEARKIITDTLNSDAYSHNNAPLGRIRPGRKTSPLRFRIVKFDDRDFRIIAIWDGRQNVTGNTVPS